MKMLFVSNVRIPSERAASIQIMKMCEAFAGEGVEVILALPWRFSRIKEDPFAFYGVDRCFTIRRIFAIDTIALEPVLGKAAFWIRTLTFRFSLWVHRLFCHFDIVYSREWFLMPKRGVLELHKFPDRVMNVHRDAWRRARKIVVITKGLKDDLVDAGVSEEKIAVEPDAVDLELFSAVSSKEEARLRFSLPRGACIVLYAGSSFSWKGVDVLVEAAKLLPEILFVLVGIDLFEGAGENVQCIGRRPYKEIPVWLAAADVLVLPNKKGEAISERYTSPLKLFEYMTSSRPIVASDISSLREILSDKTAFFVEPNNANALASGVRLALKDKRFSKEVASRAAEGVRNFSWNARARRILNVIGLNQQ